MGDNVNASTNLILMPILLFLKKKCSVEKTSSCSMFLSINMVTDFFRNTDITL